MVCTSSNPTRCGDSGDCQRRLPCTPIPSPHNKGGPRSPRQGGGVPPARAACRPPPCARRPPARPSSGVDGAGVTAGTLPTRAGHGVRQPCLTDARTRSRLRWALPARLRLAPRLQGNAVQPPDKATVLRAQRAPLLLALVRRSRLATRRLGQRAYAPSACAARDCPRRAPPTAHAAGHSRGGRCCPPRLPKEHTKSRHNFPAVVLGLGQPADVPKELLGAELCREGAQSVSAGAALPRPGRGRAGAGALLILTGVTSRVVQGTPRSTASS